MSFVAATYGGSGTGHPALAASNVEVTQINGRHTATALDTTQQVVAPEQAPSTEMFPVAPPAPPLDVERSEAGQSPAESSQAVASETPPASPPAVVDETPGASPPATELDPEETPPPLDPVAAAIPQPILAQELADAERKAAEERAAAAPAGPSIGQIQGVNVTFYDCLQQGFCGAMYNGQPVYEGAAACSWDLPLGTRFVIEDDPTGRVYVCADRGLLADTWVDIYFYSPYDGWRWQRSVGRYATIQILSLPTFDPQS